MTDATAKKPLNIPLIATIGGVVLFLGILFVTYTDAVAFGTRHETQIKATLENNQQILGQYSTKIVEMSQVTGMAADDISRVTREALSGRYGDDGSQAAVQLIVENYPGTVDPQLYRNLQSEMASGREEFKNNQTKLLDQKRVYETNLGYVIKGFWLRTAGFPKIDLDSITIVTSTYSNNAYRTGVDDGIVLRRESSTPAQ